MLMSWIFLGIYIYTQMSQGELQVDQIESKACQL